LQNKYKQQTVLKLSNRYKENITKSIFLQQSFYH